MEFDHPDIGAVYARDGYAFPIRVMSTAEAKAVRDRLEQVEAAHGPMHYVVKPYLLMNWVLELARKPEVLGAVKQILGEDLLLWDAEFIIKEPGSEKLVEWHQDLLYFGLSSDDLVTAWIAISPATRENGCMQFERGTHRRGLLEHVETHNANSVLARGQQLEAPIDQANLVDAILSPGEMSLHHGATFHASDANGSDDRRIALCLLYIKPSVKQLCADWDSALLVSGKDEYGHFERERLPDADFSPRAIEYQALIDKRRKALWREAVPANRR